ncbi:Hemolysin-type calcium-binding region:RTX N-terminal domain [Actinokineospora spheciospongiae]|uniref:Hemolysin-type calcium-binding region:RTX N-terminal domain n=1 Tax=Actinokineospora spheciospongiae TaxID=909613 RepID=W7IBJ0_9PSEU|nr:Hemolysin-type calcium-binding region:RTX N-terminal domain [Actinokineospora spheciospongiae]
MPDGGRFSHEVQDALQTPADVRADHHSENELRKLDDFTRMMGKDNLGFLYDKWRNHPACLPGNKSRWGSQPVYGDGWQEKTDQSGGLYKLKIINWGMMWGAKGRLENLIKAAGGIDGSAGAVSAKLQGAWKSGAGDLAATKFNDLRAAAMDYSTQLGQLRDHITGARQTTLDVINKLRDFPTQSDVGGKPLVDRYSSLGGGEGGGAEVRGDLSRYMDEMKRIIGQEFGGGGKGTYRAGPYAHEECDQFSTVTPGMPSFGTFQGAPGNAGEMVSFGRVMQTPETMRWAGQVHLTDGNNRWANEICHELDAFCECYFLTIGNFRRRIEEAVKAVEQAWDTLNSAATTMSADPFGKLSLSGASQPPPEEKPPPKEDKRGSTGGPRETGGTDTGGTGGSDTSTPPSAAMPPPPEVPPLPDPTQAAGVTDPTATDPTTTDPTATDPATGTPGQNTGGSPETVTITDGNRTIGVQSPDGQGHVKVTVDDGTGTPKSYDLDFGAGQPTTTPGAATPGAATPGAATPGAATPTSGFGPDGTPVAPGQDPAAPPRAEHVLAGADGKAVIHDGDLTITAERPDGAPDTVRVTVDNGTGTPQVYTLDYADGPAADSTASNPAAPTAGPPGTGQQNAGPQAQPLQAGPAGQPVAGAQAQSPQADPIGQQAASPQAQQFQADPVGQPVAGGQQQAFASGPGFGDPGVGQQSAGFGGSADGQPLGPLQEPSAATHASSALTAGDEWGAAGSAFDQDGRDGHADGLPASAQTGDVQASGSGEAGLASAQPGHQGDAAGPAGAGAAGGGMPMGGGGAMGGGGGGGGGGDSERAGSQWRTVGNLFDDDDEVGLPLGDAIGGR